MSMNSAKVIMLLATGCWKRIHIDFLVLTSNQAPASKGSGAKDG